MAEERLQKVLAGAGLGARRKCEALITAGRVKVNGAVAAELGVKVDPETDEIEVDGVPVRPAEKRVVIMFHKPAGCLTTMDQDYRGRATVMDYFRDFPERIFPVGRLDFDTEGLLLMTNDGAFSHRVAHPSHKVYKTYEAVVMGVPREGELEKLRRGLMLDDGPTSPARVRLTGVRRERVFPKNKKGHVSKEIDAAVLEISIREGRKRQVRRMCGAVGHGVLRLIRIRIGSLDLGDLKYGQWRVIDPQQAELALVEPGNND